MEILASEAAGRFNIKAVCRKMGNDLLVSVSGGRAHIGAMAVAEKGSAVKIIELDGHREGQIAQDMARMLADATGYTVAVCAGIHYDDITRQEIDLIIRMNRELGSKILSILSKGG